MEGSSIHAQGVISAFMNLGSSCKQTQNQSNIYLMKIMNQPEVWLISQDLLKQEKYSSYRLLGAQLFYRKLQRHIQQLQKSILQQLKKFVFCYLQLNFKKPPVRRLLAAAYTLIICQLSNQHIQQFFSEIHEIMKKPNGIILALALMKQFPIEIENTTSISKPRKLQLFQKLIQQKNNPENIFILCFPIKQYQEQTIQACQYWVNYGFLLIQSSYLVKVILQILKSECEEELFMNACTLLSRAIQIQKNISLRNFQKIYEAKDFKQSTILSIQYLATFFQQIELFFRQTAQSQLQNSKLQSLINIIYKVLLNFEFLIASQRGNIFQKLLLCGIKNNRVQIKVCACQFTDKLIENILKVQIQDLTEQFLARLYEFLSQIICSILPQCVVINVELLQNSSLLDQTFDQLDEQDKSFSKLRKSMSQTLISYYKLYTLKSQQQGSEQFLELISRSISLIHQQNHIRGLDISIFVMKSLVTCNNFCLYWGDFLNSFIQSLIKDYQEYSKYNGLVQKIFSMINGCSSILKIQETAAKLFDFILSFLEQGNNYEGSIKCLKNIIRNSSKLFTSRDYQKLFTFYQNSKDILGEYSQNLLQCLLICITRIGQSKQIKLSMFIGLLETIKLLAKTNIENSSTKVKADILMTLKTFLNFCLKQQDFLKIIYRNFVEQTIQQCYSIFSNIINEIKLPKSQLDYIRTIQQQINFLKVSLNLLKYLRSTEGFNHLLFIFDIIFKDFLNNFKQRSFNYIPINILSKGLSKLNKQRNHYIQSWVQYKHNLIIGCFHQVLRQMQPNHKNIRIDGIRSAYLYLQSIITYNLQLYLAYQNHQNDFFLCGLVIFQTISETSIQTQLIAYFKTCLSLNLYSSLLDSILYALFSSIKLIISSKVTQHLAQLLVVVFERASDKLKCDIKTIIRNVFQFDFLSSIDGGIKQIMIHYFYIAQSKLSLSDKSKPIRELSYILKSEVGVNYTYALKRKLQIFEQMPSTCPENNKMEEEN